MKIVTFLSRRYAAQLRPPSNAVLISIHDKSEFPLEPRHGWADVLYLRFHDGDTHSMMGLERFSADHAARVLAFVAKHVDCEQLVVHCSAGQSRSAGVALFVAESLGIPCQRPQRAVTPGGVTARREPVERREYPFYNRYVFDTLESTAHSAEGAPFMAAIGL